MINRRASDESVKHFRIGVCSGSESGPGPGPVSGCRGGRTKARALGRPRPAVPGRRRQAVLRVAGHWHAAPGTGPGPRGGSQCQSVAAGIGSPPRRRTDAIIRVVGFRVAAQFKLDASARRAAPAARRHVGALTFGFNLKAPALLWILWDDRHGCPGPRNR